MDEAHLHLERGVIYHADVRATPDGPARYSRSIGTVERVGDRWQTRSMGGLIVARDQVSRKAAIDEHDRLFHEARRAISNGTMR